MLRYNRSIIFMIFLSLVFALLGGGRLPYFLLYIIIFTIAVSYLWMKSVIGKLEFSQRTARGYAYVGDEIDIKTMVYNEGILPIPYIEINNNMIRYITGTAPVNNVVSLAPFDSRSVLEKIKCKYRGYYSFGPVNICLSDVFGLFTWTKKIDCEGALSVYPRVAALERFNIRPMQMFGTITTKQKANEDYSSISDIKKYYPGDNYKKIHWKVSAKKGSLYVKNFDMSGSSEAYIFLNLYFNDYNDIYRADIEEKAVEGAAAIIHYMLSRNINTGMYANCEKMVYIRGRDLKEFKKFLEELIRVKSNGKIPMYEMLESRARLMPRGSSIILITPKVNHVLLNKVTQLREAGFDVIIVYIMFDELSVEYYKIIMHMDIKLFKISLSDDIKLVLEG